MPPVPGYPADGTITGALCMVLEDLADLQVFSAPHDPAGRNRVELFNLFHDSFREEWGARMFASTSAALGPLRNAFEWCAKEADRQLAPFLACERGGRPTTRSASRRAGAP